MKSRFSSPPAGAPQAAPMTAVNIHSSAAAACRPTLQSPRAARAMRSRAIWLAAAGLTAVAILEPQAEHPRFIGGLAPVIVVAIDVNHRSRVAEIADVCLDTPAILRIVEAEAHIAQIV